jgi:hypothetical protein
MLFFFKPKVIHVDCFTNKAQVHELFPIDYTHKFFPEWWKVLPKVDTNHDRKEWWGIPTLKGCVGFNNFYAHGISIPFWTDVLFSIEGKQVRWQFADMSTNGATHPSEQFGSYLDPKEYFHIKIGSPWKFKCKEDVNFLWVQNSWEFSKPAEFVIPPGIIDFKYQTSTNINMFGKLLEEETKKTILIEAGTNMVNIIPLSDRKIKIHNHLVEGLEFEKLSTTGIPFKFSGKYNTVKKLMKNKENTKSKCPFHL